ncbi:competence protein ComFC [Streptococcus infantarius subsp. infantarius]|nr:competence protein ComFC [Streptococcus infantarius subsp. infantarius]
MICLLCGQEFSEKETFLGIITMRKSRYLICKECQENFEKIGDDHCPTCYRKGSKEQCDDCKKWAKENHKVSHQALYTYNEAMKEYFSKYKFQGDTMLSYVFAKEVKQVLKNYKGYTIIPVPLSKERMKERQFNQVTAILNAAKIPYHDILEKKDIKKQSEKSRKERLTSDCPFRIKSDIQIPDKVLILDDIYTTGATLKGICHLFFEKGAKIVKSLTIVR